MVCAILSCSTAVDHTPGLKKVKGSKPARWKVSFVILSYLVDLDIKGQDFGLVSSDATSDKSLAKVNK